MRRAALVALALSLAWFVACTTDYQQGKEDPDFGDPNALANQKQPGPTSESTVTTGSTATTPECVRTGGALVEAGACTTSFKGNVLAAFLSAGCSAVGCHGGTTPASQPRIDPNDGPGTWAVFAAFKLTNGKILINPCSTDPATSALGANLNPNAPAADRGVLMPPGVVGLPGAIPTIEAWQRCGSPNN
jgi:hypothetical protein